MNTTEMRRGETIRYVAAAAAALTALLYFLIGLGVLWVGDANNGQTNDIFAFGAMTGTAFAVTTVLLLRFRSRPLWVLVAALQVVVIAGYFAVSSVRTPPFEVWGLLVKACQLVVLGAVAYLAVRAPAFGRTARR